MENTAKNFALQLGSLIALYVSIGALITLLFGVINSAYPDAAEYSYMGDYTSTSIRFSIAILIVFFPTYILLTRLVNTIRRKEEGTYLKLTKWLIYLSLLVGGGVLLGDLVAVINEFLNGEITIRFTLKALTLLIVVGAAFVYYLLDARGYWQTHEQKSIRYGIGTSIIVVLSIVVGFFHTESPKMVREQRLDEQQVVDLQNMQWRIAEQYRINGVLPESLASVYTDVSIPTPPEDREPYEYNVTSSSSFELCAFFKNATKNPSEYSYYASETDIILNANNWDHAQGRVCFERFVQNVNNTNLIDSKILPSTKPMIAP